MENLVKIYQQEIQSELNNILRFWLNNALDEKNGGFIGKMDSQNQVFPEAEKGLVLNARILWTFAAAYNHIDANLDFKSGLDGTAFSTHVQKQQLLVIAQRAYQYLNEHFRDKTYGGVYWSVSYKGEPLNKRKQIYGLAFTIYGLSEYYQATQDQEALNWAIELFELIEKHSFDALNGGYFEAFSEDWHLLDDLRLSDKDRNDPKTMNTHLHIIEAYVNLYKIWQNPILEQRICHLLEVFEKHIIDIESGHMKLFFDTQWNPQSLAISYGHDIEASWLLHESAETLDDEHLIQRFRKIATRMADATAEGMNPDGSLHHEFDPETKHTDTHREWWVSAEGMVGYLNAYQLSENEDYLKKSWNLWQFAKQHLLDHQKGEWFWGVYEDMEVMQADDKIGFWKCPYHNARACMEVLKRLENLN